jgi:hypothetical protein
MSGSLGRGVGATSRSQGFGGSRSRGVSLPDVGIHAARACVWCPSYLCRRRACAARAVSAASWPAPPKPPLPRAGCAAQVISTAGARAPRWSDLCREPACAGAPAPPKPSLPPARLRRRSRLYRRRACAAEAVSAASRPAPPESLLPSGQSRRPSHVPGADPDCPSRLYWPAALPEPTSTAEPAALPGPASVRANLAGDALPPSPTLAARRLRSSSGRRRRSSRGRCVG